MFVDDKQFEKEAGKVFWALVASFTAVSGLFLYLGSLG
jgi:hypothetical protein